MVDVHTLKVGDHVTLVKACQSRQGGWHNSWVHDMDSAIGCAGVVRQINWDVTSNSGQGIAVDFSDVMCFRYPPEALELAVLTGEVRDAPRGVYCRQNC